MKETQQQGEPIALVDMDGTLCDYTGALRPGLEAMRDPAREPPLPDDIWEIGDLEHIKARMEFIKAIPGWWAGLERLEVNFRVLELMQRMAFDIHILTKGPYKATGGWTEKVHWCREHVPEASIHISEDKGLVYGKVLMDDYPVYIHRWLQWRPRGLVIMPAWPGNAGFSHPNVVRWDGSDGAWAEVEERLWAVRLTAAGAPDRPE